MLDAKQLGLLFSSGFLGLALGNFVWGPVADSIGRKTVIVVSMLIFSFASLGSAFAPSITWLIGFRFLTGLGLGGALPNAITLASEYCPPRHKALLITTVLLAFPGGLALSGLTASISIPAFGWKSVFIIGWMAPLLLVPVVWLFLPESVQFMQRKGPAGQAHIEQTAQPHSSPLFALFSEGVSVGTAILWMTFFCSMWAYYQVTNWLPVLITGAGVNPSQASTVASLFPFGGLIGSLVAAWIMDKCNRYAVLAAYYFLGALLTGVIGFCVHSPELLSWVVFSAGIALGGVQPSLIYLAADFYPDDIRATGVAWGLGVGRLGSIVGAATGGAVLAGVRGIEQAFPMFAVPVLVAGLGMSVMIWLYRVRSIPNQEGDQGQSYPVNGGVRYTRTGSDASPLRR